ncbi:hypothetical protein O181_057781 [Austropuccinia psidii MF-1]|uniref:Peptidase A2 domain-containing protein n=1 Tax=Austropuccinia psidii MF-1 TaxID=1389203 RepID=A0A9Q3HU91_9BASI|nr:hypothetical protein [Austropuccinia psidii MF-1]
MAFVDTGSEINIILEEIAIKASLTSRNLNMNFRGIGGNTISLVGLSEFKLTTMIPGEEKEIHLFIAKGAVRTILRRPFLADNNVKLEFSHKHGEIFSYPEKDGFTFGNEEKIYLDILVFDSFNQIIGEEKSSILSSSKESIPPETEGKSKAKDQEEDKFKVEDSETIEKVKEELKKMRRNLDMAIEVPEKCLALKLSGMSKEDEVESPQKKLKMDLKRPEANSSGIAEDYFNLLQEETR